MRKWFLLVLTTVFCCTALAAQVQTRLQKPPMNTLRLKDMWNMTLRNTTAKPITLTLRGTADEASEGRIVEGRTGQFILQANESRVFNSDNVPGGGKYSWNSKRFQEAIVRTGNAPSGSYTICVYAEDQTGRQLGQDCIQQIVAISQPPVLIAPSNNEVFKAGMNPTFIWMQPAPSTPGTIYTLRLVEVFGEQSPIDAMMKNSSVIEQRDLRNTSMQYPPSARKLEVGKRYAWQVSITVDGQRSQSTESSKSEVWTFTYVGVPTMEKVVAPVVAPIIVDTEFNCRDFTVSINPDTTKDSGLYRIIITNNSRTANSAVLPTSIRIDVKGDSIFGYGKEDAKGWERTPSTFPPGTSTVAYKTLNAIIDSGNTDLGCVKLSSAKSNPLFIYSWLNKAGKEMCKDSVRFGATPWYYQLSDEESTSIVEVRDSVLHVQFQNHYAAASDMEIVIIDADSLKPSPLKSGKKNIVPTMNGLNRIGVSLNDYDLSAGKSYVLHIATAKTRYELNFMLVSDKATNDREK